MNSETKGGIIISIILILIMSHFALVNHRNEVKFESMNTHRK